MRIKANFYMIDGYKYERMTDEEYEQYKDSQFLKSNYWFVFKSLPDGRLYSGNSFQYPTKITANDLPQDYTLLSNYDKHGYIRTAGIKDLYYDPCIDHSHPFKDDFLFISYGKSLSEYDKHGFGEDSIYNNCDEYIWGWDIVTFIKAAEINSPEFDVTEIKEQIVKQYNLYVNEMKRRQSFIHKDLKHISCFEELCD